MQLHHDMLVKLTAGNWRVDRFGRWYPDIRGAATDEEEGEDDDDTGDSSKPEKTYTQKDLDRMLAREKREGAKAAARKVMEDLDFDTLDEAKAFIEEAKGRSSKEEQDTSKRLERAAEKERKANAKLLEAVETLNTTKVVAKLIAAKMDPKLAERLGPTVNLDLTDENLDLDDIADAVDELREDMPQLFSSDEPQEEETPVRAARRPADSTPRGERRPPAKGSDMLSRGRSKYQELYGDKVKS